MDHDLFRKAEAGALILTVNDRLSRHLHMAYDSMQQLRGTLAWPRPEILSYAAWLSRCRKQLPEPLIVLNNAQLQKVWESIIEQDIKRSGFELLHIPQTANRARQAHQLLVSYAASFGHEESARDHMAFLRWRKAWQHLSQEKGWHDPAELPWQLAESLMNNSHGLPGELVFAGFDEIPPDLQNLINALKTSGHRVDYWQPESYKNVTRQSYMASDPVDEVRQCARWAYNILKENPAARIGVIAPQLEAYQGHVERIFTAEIEPSVAMGINDGVQTFNLSLGKSLDTEEIVHSALRLLRCENRVEQADLSWLLHTPYLAGSGAESFCRARLDRELLRLRRSEWSTLRLPRLIEGLSSKHSLPAPEFSKILESIGSEAKKGRKRLPGAWAEHFSIFLQKIGWPGERGLSSREYQAFNSFKNILAEFASLDSVVSEIPRAEAMQTLTSMVSTTSFQPEGKNAPVQILGELESAGLLFDHVWVLGLHDRALPRSPAPSPFIPLPVQRRYGMKRADAEREHQFAVRVAGRIFSAAPHVILSWPATEDGAPLQPSPLVPQNLPAYDAVEDAQTPSAQVCGIRPQHEILSDTQGPALPPRRTFSGGTGLLKDQALCPFRAYAHFRLRAEQAETPDIGIDNMSRGTLVHTVLELFWEKVTDRSRLESLSPEELDVHLIEAVNAALDRLERENRYDLPLRQREIEGRRLRKLAKAWLALEKGRSDFTVLAAEKGQQVAIGDLVIRTRIDRIDKLADGTCAIIDYKTGRPDPSQWLGARITEPQLPVYCLAMPANEVGAVMFGVVRGKEKERGFKGLARNIEAWPGAKSRTLDRLLEEKEWGSFDRILEHWQSTLSMLGDAFARGDAEVDPVDVEKACKYCDLKRLCRISEKYAVWQEDKNA